MQHDGLLDHLDPQRWQLRIAAPVKRRSSACISWLLQWRRSRRRTTASHSCRTSGLLSLRHAKSSALVRVPTSGIGSSRSTISLNTPGGRSVIAVPCLILSVITRTSCRRHSAPSSSTDRRVHAYNMTSSTSRETGCTLRNPLGSSPVHTNDFHEALAGPAAGLAKIWWCQQRWCNVCSAEREGQCWPCCTLCKLLALPRIFRRSHCCCRLDSPIQPSRSSGVDRLYSSCKWIVLQFIYS